VCVCVFPDLMYHSHILVSSAIDSFLLLRLFAIHSWLWPGYLHNNNNNNVHTTCLCTAFQRCSM
jgi:hypothetical protein